MPILHTYINYINLFRELYVFEGHRELICYVMILLLLISFH